MCSSRKILWSLLLLSVVEVGLGVASIVLGAVGISWVRGDHKPQQGDASPVWSGLCVRPGNNSCRYFFSCLLPKRISISMDGAER
uniref:Transmembrane protein 196 n=1 Tax=Amphilophus citrinellus TaxID=61819 RepID=A0A3Q0RS15_AMPCI